MPEMILLEDANDLCTMHEAAGRAVLRESWVEALRAAAGEAALEGLF